MSENMWNDVSKAEVERLRAELAQVDEIGRLRAEIDALKASNAELRASADEAQAARLQAVAEAAALKARVEMTNEALEEIRDEAEQAQGDWSSVDELEAPEWCTSYKVIFDIARVALKGEA